MATKFRTVPHHRRHHSWPPIRLLPSHLQHHTMHPAPPPLLPAADAMDEDPFAFFLSDPSEAAGVVAAKDPYHGDEEEYISDWMNANIPDGGVRRRTRSVSLFDIRRYGMGPDPDDILAHASTYDYSAQRPASPSTAITRLRSWMERMEKMYFSWRPLPADLESQSPESLGVSPDMLPVPLPVTPSPPLRGRKRVRTSKSVGNRAVRPYMAHVRTWREPSEGMWTLSEEEEYEEIGSPISL